MQAIHWLRSRQEDREISYLLSIVYYDKKDESISNRLYLFYLLVFFSVWIFVVLTFFAGGGAIILRLIDPKNVILAATDLQLLILGVWNLFSFWKALRKSPVVFSEEDASLVCQMPLSRRGVVMRWFAMPWLKSAIPFWLTAITIGFSCAEVTMPGVLGVDRIFDYARYGIRAWVAIIPIQLALAALPWVIGVFRLQKDKKRDWLLWPAMIVSLLFWVTLLISLFSSSAQPVGFWSQAARNISAPLLIGFGSGNLAVSWSISMAAALTALCLLFWVSGPFSLSRAALETQETELLGTAVRFRMTEYANELKTRDRLGVDRPPSRLPAFPGARMFLWKDFLQSQRSLQFAGVMSWLMLFGLMLWLPFLPDFSSRAIVLIFWAINLGKGSVIRLKNDLSRWSLVRQIPITRKKFLVADLFLPILLTISLSLLGLGVGLLLAKVQLSNLLFILPGMVISAAAMAAFDVIRRSRSNLLIIGSVPDVGVVGIFLCIMVVEIPFALISLSSSITVLLLGILMSGLLAWISFTWAYRTFKNIDAA